MKKFITKCYHKIRFGTLFSNEYENALRIIDNHGVTCLITNIYKRKLYIVEDPKYKCDLSLLEELSNCQCADFKRHLSKQFDLICSHIIACFLAESLGMIKIKNIADGELDINDLNLEYIEPKIQKTENETKLFRKKIKH